MRNISRLLVFRLGGTASLPAEPQLARPPLDPPPSHGTPEQLAAGSRAYARYCGVCHGDAAYGSTLVPDLRRSAFLKDRALWDNVVAGGALADAGMASFRELLDGAQIESIRQYVIQRANEDKALGIR